MVGVGSNLPSHRFFLSALRLIKDKGILLYDHVSSCEYVECQDDVLAVSGMVEDIRDALINYQVGAGRDHAITV